MNKTVLQVSGMKQKTAGVGRLERNYLKRIAVPDMSGILLDSGHCLDTNQ